MDTDGKISVIIANGHGEAAPENPWSARLPNWTGAIMRFGSVAFLAAGIATTVQLWSSQAYAGSACDFVLQWDRDTLTHCIDELNKRIEDNQRDINILRSENNTLLLQLCILALEQQRTSEAARFILESCPKSRPSPKKQH